nr:hypothetical protein [Tanacetum cinerariifolium]
MDQNIDSSGFDQIQTSQYPVIHHHSQEMSEEVLKAKGNLMKSIQTFLEKFNCIPFEEMPKILLQEYLENSSNAIAASNFNQKKEGPPQDSDIRQLVREECGIKVCENQKQNMEDTMLELLEVCREKEFYCMHNNVDDLIKSALNSKLFLINLKSHRLDKEKHEVKNVVEQPTKRGTRIAKSLQNFRVKKSSISLNNTSQTSPVHAITPVLTTEEPEYSLSMGYEHLSTTSETESDEVIESSVKNLVPILREYEVASDNERVLMTMLLRTSSMPDSELVSLEEENDVYQQDEEFNLEENFQIQDVVLRKKLLSINRLIADIESLNDNRTLVLKSSASIPLFNKSDNSLLDNSLPEFETFSDHTEETRGGSTTAHANNSLPEYDSFCFEIEPDQERLTIIVMDINFLEELLKPPDVEFFFDFESNSGEVISTVMKNIDELNEDECFDLGGEINVFANVEDDDYFPFIFVIRVFLPYLIYLEVVNSKLLSINLKSQHLDKEKQEVKNVVEQPTKRETRIAKSLQNFRVKKSSISLNNTSQTSPVHAITPVLTTKKPEYSLSMGYEHLSTTSEMKSDEVIESSVKNLVPILREYEVAFDNERVCDVLVCEDSLDVLEDHSEILSNSNNDDISSDDDAFEDIEYVEASLPDSELVSLEEENDVYQQDEEFNLEEIFQIQDVVLREKLLSINRLIADIESLNDDRTPVLNDHTKGTRGGSTTAHANNSLPEYDSFCFEIEPDQERLTSVVMKDISDDLSNDPLLEEVDLFLPSDNSIPPGIENIDYDSEGDIHNLEELLSNDSIFLPENESSNFDHHDDPSFPRPPPKPPDVEFFFDFESKSGEVISTVIKILMSLMKMNVLIREERLMFLQMLKMTITFPSYLSFEFFYRISSNLRFLLYFSPLGVKTPFLTLESPFRAGGISLGWNFHVL